MSFCIYFSCFWYQPSMQVYCWHCCNENFPLSAALHVSVSCSNLKKKLKDLLALTCSGLVTLSTQLWREVTLISRLLYKYNTHSAFSLNRLRKLCCHPSSGRFGYTLFKYELYELKNRFHVFFKFRFFTYYFHVFIHNLKLTNFSTFF